MQYIDCSINPISRQVSYPGAVIVQRDTNVEALRFHYSLQAEHELENDSIRVMVKTAKEIRGFNAENVRVETNDGGDEELVFEHTITRYETEVPGQINVSVCGNQISGDTITEAWHTLNMSFQVGSSVHTDSDEGEDSEETKASNAEKIAALQTLVDAITSGRPIPVDTKSKMTDTSAIYLYTGNETGEQHNYWYYHDGTTWVPGSEYGGMTIDDELSSTSENAVQNKVIKAKYDELNERLNDFESNAFETVLGKNLYNPEDTTVGFLLANGSVSATGSYSAYLTSGFIPIENNTTYFFTERTAVETITSTRYSSLLYSEDKTPIAESYQNVDATSGIAIVVNDATAKYMRVSVHYWEGRLLQVEKGESATSYQPYSETYKLVAELGDAPTAQVEEIINNSGLLVTEIGRNLVNPENLVEGAVQSTGVISTAGSWATYSTSDFVPLDANTDYVFSTFNATTGNSTTNRKTLLLYDSSKTVINNTYQNVDGAFQLTFNSSDNAKFVRVSSWTSVLFQLEKGTTRTPYAPYKSDVVLGVGLGETPMEQAQGSNILYGKKWAVCGDSFTNGATTTIISDGKYAGRKFTYPYLIGNRNNMDIVKFFEGGRTLTYPSDGTFLNSITNPSADYYYQNIPTDVDYITIYLGINDSQHTGSGTTGDGEDATGVITLGSIDDTDTSTYYGAWNTVLTWLIINRPYAHIGIIVTNGLSQSKADWRTAQINIANKYGIPYIDLNGDSRTPAMIRTINQNIPGTVKTALINKWAVDPSSNTHPNDAAHEFESTFIENFLRSL